MRKEAQKLFKEAERLYARGEYAAAAGIYLKAKEKLLSVSQENKTAEPTDIRDLALCARRGADAWAEYDYVEAFEESAKLYEEAGNILEGISNPTPEDLENQANDFYCCAQLYSRTGMRNKSLSLFLKAKDIFEKIQLTPILPKTNNYRVYNLSCIGEIYFEEKNWIKAAEFYQKAIGLRSNSSTLDFFQKRNHEENLVKATICRRNLLKTGNGYSISHQDEPDAGPHTRVESKKEPSQGKAESNTQKTASTNRKRKADGEPNKGPGAEVGNRANATTGGNDPNKRLKTSHHSNSHGFMPLPKGNSSSTDEMETSGSLKLTMGS